MNEIKRERMEQVGEVEERRQTSDRRVMVSLSIDQLRRIGVQVAEHFMREDRAGAWQLMLTYNMTAQRHYQLMAFAIERLNIYNPPRSPEFIQWIASIHLN